jgi:hypothetical protein
VQDYSAIYEAFYRSLAKFPVFGRGWINRLNDVTAQALAWSDDEPVKPGQPETPMPGEPGAPAVPGYDLPDADVIGKILSAAVPLFVQYGPAILKCSPRSRRSSNQTPASRGGKTSATSKPAHGRLPRKPFNRRTP